MHRSDKGLLCGRDTKIEVINVSYDEKWYHSRLLRGEKMGSIMTFTCRKIKGETDHSSHTNSEK